MTFTSCRPSPVTIIHPVGGLRDLRGGGGHYTMGTDAVPGRPRHGGAVAQCQSLTAEVAEPDS